MKKTGKQIRAFLADESGQGTMEYILIVGLIVIALMVTMYLFRDQLRAFITKVNDWIKGAEGQVGS